MNLIFQNRAESGQQALYIVLIDRQGWAIAGPEIEVNDDVNFLGLRGIEDWDYDHLGNALRNEYGVQDLLDRNLPIFNGVSSQSAFYRDGMGECSRALGTAR